MPPASLSRSTIAPRTCSTLPPDTPTRCAACSTKSSTGGARPVIRHKTPHALGVGGKLFALELINDSLFEFAQQVAEREFKFAIQVCFPRLVN
jgi:hypothetical protein